MSTNKMKNSFTLSPLLPFTPPYGVVAQIIASISTLDNEIDSFVIPAIVTKDFSYPFECNVFPHAGDWNLSLSWSGNEGYSGCKSKHKILVQKAHTSLQILNSNSKMKLNDSLDIKGKIENTPSCIELLKGLPVSLTLISPDERVITLTTHSTENGRFEKNTFDVIDTIGQWEVIAHFHGNASYSPSTSDSIYIDVVETAGYAVIVQGRNDEREGLDAHNNTVQFIQKTLKKRGLLDTDFHRCYKRLNFSLMIFIFLVRQPQNFLLGHYNFIFNFI